MYVYFSFCLCLCICVCLYACVCVCVSVTLCLGMSCVLYIYTRMCRQMMRRTHYEILRQTLLPMQAHALLCLVLLLLTAVTEPLQVCISMRVVCVCVCACACVCVCACACTSVCVHVCMHNLQKQPDKAARAHNTKWKIHTLSLSLFLSLCNLPKYTHTCAPQAQQHNAPTHSHQSISL